MVPAAPEPIGDGHGRSADAAESIRAMAMNLAPMAGTVAVALLLAGLLLPYDAAQAKKCEDYPEDHPVRQIPYCQSQLPRKQGEGFLSDLINLPNTVVKDAADAVLGRSGESGTEQASESDETGTVPEVEQERTEAGRGREADPATGTDMLDLLLRGEEAAVRGREENPAPVREPTPAEAAALERVRAMLEAHQAREVCAETALEQGEIVTEPAVLGEALAGHEAAVKIRDAETGEFLFAVRAVCEAGEPAEWVLAGLAEQYEAYQRDEMTEGLREEERSREEIFRDFASDARRSCYGEEGWRHREEECVSLSVDSFRRHTKEICDLPVSGQAVYLSFGVLWIKDAFEERLCDELGY